MSPLALIPHLSAAGLGYMGLIGLAAVANPAFSVYKQEAVGKVWRPTMAGALTMAVGLGQAWIAISGGYIIAGFGVANLYWLDACMAASSTLLFATYLYGSARRTRRTALV